MPGDLDDILQAVAAGDLSPDEALLLLERDGDAPGPGGESAPAGEPADPASPGDPTKGSAPAVHGKDVRGKDVHGNGSPGPWPSDADGEDVPETEPPAARLMEVRLQAAYRSIDVIGDPTVAEALVTGPHVLRYEDGALVIDNPDSANTVETPEGRFNITAVPWGLAKNRALRDHLVVRVNPLLRISGELAGNALKMSGCDGGVRMRAVASAIKLDRVRGPFDVNAVSSTVKGCAGLTGACRIRAESSSVALGLLAGTDVRIQARNRMGKITFPGSSSRGALVDAETLQGRIGKGTGSLEIEALVSTVKLWSER